MLPDLWTAPTDAPPTRSLEIAPRFPQQPQPKPTMWCQLLSLDLRHDLFRGLRGVYVIWHGGSAARTVRVGQGVIADRLAKHRNDPAILL